MQTLTETVLSIEGLKEILARHEKEAAARTAELKQEIQARREVLEMSASGIDLAKVSLAETVLCIGGQYAKGGAARASVVNDAMLQLATGTAKSEYSNLWNQYLGTKDYAHWYGQRTDCEYGLGPTHGSIVFSVGLTGDVRKRNPKTLTPDEIEAAIYYLTNIERIQSARAAAKSEAA